jgi:hypothetical protein
MMAINHNSVGLDGANATSSTLTVSECNRNVEYNCVLLHTSNERRVTIEGSIPSNVLLKAVGKMHSVVCVYFFM